MTTQKVDNFLYWEEDLEAIAAALNVDAKSVSLFRSRFDAAATNPLDPPDYFELVPDRQVQKTLASIEKAAKRLIHQAAALIVARNQQLPIGCDIDPASLPRYQASRFRHQIDKLIDLLCFDDEDMEDGMPGSPIVSALLKGRPKDEPVLGWRPSDEFVIRDLVRMLQFRGKDPHGLLLAANDLVSRARDAQSAVGNVRKLTLPKVNSGDLCFNAWTDEMLNLYKAITRSPIKTAVGKPGWENEGIAYGRVIEFLKAAINPLEDSLIEKGIIKEKLGEDAWRSRVRTAERARTKYAENLAIRQ